MGKIRPFFLFFLSLLFLSPLRGEEGVLYEVEKVEGRKVYFVGIPDVGYEVAEGFHVEVRIPGVPPGVDFRTVLPAEGKVFFTPDRKVSYIILLKSLPPSAVAR